MEVGCGWVHGVHPALIAAGRDGADPGAGRGGSPSRPEGGCGGTHKQ